MCKDMLIVGLGPKVSPIYLLEMTHGIVCMFTVEVHATVMQLSLFSEFSRSKLLEVSLTDNTSRRFCGVAAHAKWIDGLLWAKLHPKRHMYSTTLPSAREQCE